VLRCVEYGHPLEQLPYSQPTPIEQTGKPIKNVMQLWRLLYCQWVQAIHSATNLMVLVQMMTARSRTSHSSGLQRLP